jgi:hypothetical protein
MSDALDNWKNTPGIRGLTYRLGLLRQRAGFVVRGAGGYAALRLRRNGSRPRIAAVVVGRNDDYMSDFATRLFATLEWNIRYLVSEVVFVEWNPPPNRELLAAELTRRFECLRAYVVPPQIHADICENPHVPLLEYHAKNVGIRRAQSPWIITTNADAALGLDTVNRILHAELDPSVAWTAERVDIAWREDEQQHIDLMGSLRYGRFIPYHQLGTGEFMLASRELWQRTRGYDEALVRHRIGCDVRGAAQMLASGANINFAGSVLHLAHPTSCTENVTLHQGEMATIEGVPYQNTETWGMGDFREVQLADRVWQLEK